jgi:signal transduction histidine kinase
MRIERLGRGPAAAADRLRAHPLAADALLAAVLAVVSLVVLAYASQDCGHGCRPGDAGAVGLVVLQTLPLVWRRRRPLATGLIAGLAALVYGAAPYPDLGLAVAPGGLLALYTLAAWCSRRTALLVGAAVAVGTAAIMLWPGTDADAIDVTVGALTLATAWVLGDRARIQRAWTAGLEDRAERLERERVAEARRAVAEERTRIARELHDVVAHHVSMMVVQAEAGPVVVEREPARAAGVFDSIGATGRQALVEMRRLLEVLRGDGDATPSLAPQPGLDEVPALVEQVGRTGLAVELVVEGEPRALPVGVDLSAYRIVQEALTNAVRHAGPGRARVLVRYGEHDLELRVSNDGRGAAANPTRGPGDADDRGGLRPPRPPRPRSAPPRGQGLVGMRERVNLFGGELHAGPGPEGGFTVAARLPIGDGR